MTSRDLPGGRADRRTVLPVSARLRWSSIAGLTALQTVHLIARGNDWTVDVPWAVNQYLFSMVFFGPVVAALAAWQGRVFGRTRWLCRVHPVRALATLLGPVVAWAMTAFLIGAVAGVMAAVGRGAPLVWGVDETAGVVVATVGVGAYAAAGFAVASLRPHPMAPPLVAVATFILTIAAWIGGLDVLARFGGASGGVLGLQVRPDALSGRAAFWAGSLLLALVLAIAPIQKSTASRLTAMAAAGTMALGLAFAATAPNNFRPADIAWACDGARPQVCVPERMARFLPQITDSRTPLFVAQELQAASNGTADVWHITDSLVFAALAEAHGTVDPEATKSATARMLGETQSLYAPVCLPDPTRRLSAGQEAARARLNTWMFLTTDPFTEHTGDEFIAAGVPHVPLGSPAARTFMGGVLDGLPACPE